MAKDFSSSHAVLPARRLEGGTKNWEGTQPGQLVPQTKGIFQTVWQHAGQKKKKGRVSQGVVSAAWGLTGHHSVSGKQLLCASLGLCILLSSSLLLLFSFSVLLNCHCPDLWALPFCQLSSPSHHGASSEGWMVFCCLLGLNTTIVFSPSYPHFIPLESWMPDLG